MTWVTNYAFDYWGQVWVQSDCTVRASVLFPGSWVLMLDVDEVIDAPPGSSLLSLSQTLADRNYHGITFGSVPFATSVCLPENISASSGFLHRAYYRTNPECGESEGPDFSRCTGHWGRRKWMLSTTGLLERVSDVTTHYLGPKFVIYDSSATEFYLRHVRGIFAGGLACTNSPPFQLGSCIPRRFNGACASWLPWNTGRHNQWWIDQRHISSFLQPYLCADDHVPDINC